MSQGLDLLYEALDLARKEKSALEEGSYEEAIELAEKRGNITKMAWNVFKEGERAPYHKRLLELSGIQAQLTEIASAAQSVIRQKLSRSKLEKKRIQGYHLAVGQALQ